MVEDPAHVEKQHAREPGDLRRAYESDRPVSEGAKPNGGRVRAAGVGPLRSTNEAAEQRGAILGGGGGGKAAAQGERRAIQHQSDTERETGVPGIERRAPSGAGKEARAVHCFAASCDVKSAAGEFRCIEEECGSRGGRRDMARV